VPDGLAERRKNKPNGHDEHAGDGDGPSTPKSFRWRGVRVSVLDTGYDGIDEDTACPGEAVAQSANKG